MNVISYNDKDLETLYNKYRMSSYYPNDTTNSQNIPQYTAIGNNLLVNTSMGLKTNINSNPLENKDIYIENIKPIPSLAERNRQQLLKEGDKIFDDLELYGLVLTNDLLKLRRLQQMTNKNDFSVEFSSFRKRLYVNIDNVGEKMVNSIKNINTEFESVENSMKSYFKRNLARNTEINTRLDIPFKDLTEGLNGQINKMTDLFRKRAERFKTLKHFLYPPKIESGIVIPEELKIDWDKRMERLREAAKYRILNDDYAQKLKFSKQKMELMNKVAVKEKRVRNIKYREFEKKKKENQLNFLKEQDRREFDMLEEMDKFEKELDEEERKEMEDLKKKKELEEIERQKQLENGEIESEKTKKSKSKKSKSKKSKSKSKKREEDSEDESDSEEEEEEEEDEESEMNKKVRQKEFDYTDLMTKKYQKSEKKSEVSSLPKNVLARDNKNEK